MNDIFPSGRYSIGQALSYLRRNFCRDSRELYAAINTSSATYLKIERDERDLSFLMALRVCQFYDLDIHDFIAMIDDAELGRKDLSSIKMLINRGKQKEREAIKAKSNNIQP
jgi:hypothetical protein